MTDHPHCNVCGCELHRNGNQWRCAAQHHCLMCGCVPALPRLTGQAKHAADAASGPLRTTADA